MMVMATFLSQFMRYLTVDFFGSFLAFPVWWYGRGFIDMLSLVGRMLLFRIKSYNLVLWIKNILVPMYGQYDIAGRLVSLFMRIVVLIGRCIALAVETLAYVVFLIVWLMAPLVAIVGIAWNLTAAF